MVFDLNPPRRTTRRPIDMRRSGHAPTSAPEGRKPPPDPAPPAPPQGDSQPGAVFRWAFLRARKGTNHDR